eukprot:gene35187-45572_t
MSDLYLEWALKPPTSSLISDGGFLEGDTNWFTGGKINACYNCLDKHIGKRANQNAIIWEGDEPGQNRFFTYADVLKKVCRIANVLKSKGVQKGDVVTIYMPMIPETAMVMLACARIGAVHSVVFAGFSSDSLRDRMVDCNSRFLVVADEGRRGGKTLKLKDIADKALKSLPQVDTVFTFNYAEQLSPSSPSSSPSPSDATMVEGRDVWMHELLPK